MSTSGRMQICWISWLMVSTFWSEQFYFSCCRTAMGVGQRALSLSAHMAGGPPPHSWPQGGWRHHASSSEYSQYYWDVAAAWNRWFLTIWERASTPSLTLEVLVAGVLSAAAFASGVGGMDHGTWRRRRTVRVHRRLWICPSAATPTLRETSATPRRSGYGDTSSFGPLKAWDWFLRPTRLTLVFYVPPATPTCA